MYIVCYVHVYYFSWFSCHIVTVDIKRFTRVCTSAVYIVYITNPKYLLVYKSGKVWCIEFTA